MINLNGKLTAKDKIALVYNNRAFTYGDALFETLKFQDNKIQFLEDHYFRLMASMRMLRMEIPNNFTLDFFEQEILKTIKANNLVDLVRMRFQVYRKIGGFYLPKTNDINFLIEASEILKTTINFYEIDLFKDSLVFSGLLSTLKTTNRIINVLASIYTSENTLDNCVLLNEKKNIVEFNNGNIFIIKDNIIKTPAITEGCIKGIIRKKLIEMFQENNNTIIETEISPFELQKADAVFMTNSIVGIQEVHKYRKKEFDTTLVAKVKNDFERILSVYQSII